MTEMVSIIPEERVLRDQMLHGKKRTVLTALIVLICVSCVPLVYVVQNHETWMITLGAALAAVIVSASGGWFYGRFLRNLNADLRSDEKRIVSAMIVIDRDAQKENRAEVLLIEIEGRRMILTEEAVRSTMGADFDFGLLFPGTRLSVEMTPHSRLITAMELAGIAGEPDEIQD